MLSKPPTQGKAGVLKIKYFVGKITSRMPPHFFSEPERQSVHAFLEHIFLPSLFPPALREKPPAFINPTYLQTVLVSKMQRVIC